MRQIISDEEFQVLIGSDIPDLHPPVTPAFQVGDRVIFTDTGYFGVRGVVVDASDPIYPGVQTTENGLIYTHRNNLWWALMD